MASVTTSNMSLIIPSIGTELAPTWAQDINNSLQLIDQHNHTPGSGLPITPAAMSIDADLALNNFNLVTIRSARFTAQDSPLAEGTDLDCVYVSGVDLYYNDGNGNQVRITQSGGVAGSPGSIAGLTSPASATYVAGTQTFVWQSAANTAANMDGGSLKLRNITAGSNAVTINPPAALAANYSLTLPAALPGSTKFLTLDASGNIGNVYDVDNVTIQIAANNLQVKDGGITLAKMAALSVGTSQLVDGAATYIKQGPANSISSSSSGSFTDVTTTPVDVTNLSVSLTVDGTKRVRLFLTSDGTSNPASLAVASTTGGSTLVRGQFYLLQNGSIISNNDISMFVNGGTSVPTLPPSVCETITPVLAAGTYTFKMQIAATAANVRINVTNCRLNAYELT